MKEMYLLCLEKRKKMKNQHDKCISTCRWVDGIIKRMFVLSVQERSKIFSEIVLVGY